MMNPGLTSEGMDRLLATLCMPHNVRVVVQLLDMNERHVDSLTPYFHDGQVTIAANSDVSRSANLTFLDPYRRIGLDTASVAEGSLYADRMVAIYYCVWREGDARSVDIPIFRGPVTLATREGSFLVIEALGKEILAKFPVWNARTYRQGHNKTKMIEDWMRNTVGESRLALSPTKAKIGKDFTLGRGRIPWTETGNTARSMSMLAFYDGRGVLQMREYAKDVCFTFRDGNGGSLRGEPSIKFDSTTLRNGVAVKTDKAKYDYNVWAPAEHPLSPQSLARTLPNGTRVHHDRVEIIEDNEISSKAEAKKRAETRLAELLEQSVEVSANVLPIPLLEEGDLLAIQVAGRFNVPFRMRDQVIPLRGLDGTLGNNKNVRLKRRS